MMYAIGDRVQLAAELGGATGYVTDVIGGPQGEGSVRVSQPWGQSEIDDGMVLPPSLVTPAPLVPAPVYQVGQAVTLAGEAGEITAIDGDLVEISVEVLLTARRRARRGRRVPLGEVVYMRLHRVPVWRLGMEN